MLANLFSQSTAHQGPEIHRLSNRLPGLESPPLIQQLFFSPGSPAFFKRAIKFPCHFNFLVNLILCTDCFFVNSNDFCFEVF